MVILSELTLGNRVLDKLSKSFDGILLNLGFCHVKHDYESVPSMGIGAVNLARVAPDGWSFLE